MFCKFKIANTKSHKYGFWSQVSQILPCRILGSFPTPPNSVSHPCTVFPQPPPSYPSGYAPHPPPTHPPHPVNPTSPLHSLHPTPISHSPDSKSSPSLSKGCVWIFSRINCRSPILPNCRPKYETPQPSRETPHCWSGHPFFFSLLVFFLGLKLP